MIDALQRNNYRISGVMQLLSSSAPSYDEATIKHHLRLSQKVIKEVEKKKLKHNSLLKGCKTKNLSQMINRPTSY
jgi:hypothetical protein